MYHWVFLKNICWLTSKGWGKIKREIAGCVFHIQLWFNNEAGQNTFFALFLCFFSALPTLEFGLGHTYTTSHDSIPIQHILVCETVFHVLFLLLLHVGKQIYFSGTLAFQCNSNRDTIQFNILLLSICFYFLRGGFQNFQFVNRGDITLHNLLWFINLLSH